MGQAKKKQLDEYNKRQRRANAWHERKKKLKRAPRALFYSLSFLIWFPILVFKLALESDDFPWGENK